jgi:hypothetical protein
MPGLLELPPETICPAGGVKKEKQKNSIQVFETGRDSI